MNWRLVYVRPEDGGVSVVIPSPNFAGGPGSLSARSVPAGVTALIVDSSELPSRRFRNSWSVLGGKPVVDMAKARVQRMSEIRAERDKLLKATDADKARLDDIGTQPQKQALAAYRQALRDIPLTVEAAVDGAQTPEALEALQPAWPVKP